MANASAPVLLVSLASEDEVGRVVVRLETFLNFAHDVSIALENIETDWLHAASPQSRRQSLVSDRRCIFSEES